MIPVITGVQYLPVAHLYPYLWYRVHLVTPLYRVHSQRILSALHRLPFLGA